MSVCLQADFDVLVDKLLSMGSECESLRTQLAERDSDREYLAAAMIRCSFATADGDTLRALVDEMEPQVVDLYAKLAESREWNRQMVEKAAQKNPTLDGYRGLGAKCAALEAQLAEAQRERDKLREFVAAFDAWQTGPPPMRGYYDTMLEKRAAVGD